MLEQDEKATVTVEKTDPSELIVANAANPNKISDSDSDDAETRKAVQQMSDDEYPQGFKLVLLAGASLVAVFLIALDQVSNYPCEAFPPNKRH